MAAGGDGAVIPLIQLIVAVEVLLLPAWVGAVFVRPRAAVGWRLARTPAVVLVVGVVVLVLAAVAGEGLFVGAVRAQAVAVGWVVLLVGVACFTERVAGPRPAQVVTALVGWGVLAAAVLAGPAAELLEGAVKEAVVRAVVHANPLVLATREVGLNWLHQSRTYRLTPVGESYAYLLGGTAWYKTMLAHVFVGSGLLVFSLRRSRGSDGSP